MTTPELIRLLLAMPLLAWLPGAVAWWAFAGRRPGSQPGGLRPESTSLQDGVHSLRAGLQLGEPSSSERRSPESEGAVRLDRLEQFLVEIFTSLFITALLATFLAELGIFSLASLLGGLTVACLVLWWRTEVGSWILDIRYWLLAAHSKIQYLISNIQSLFSPWTAGLLATLALAMVLFFRPAEAILVMDDAGVYLIHGLTLARTGGLFIHDRLLPFLSSEAAGELLRFVPFTGRYIRHEGAFHISNWNQGLIQPSFFHLPSIWMAVLACAAGSRAAIWATPLAGLLSIVTLALLGRRLFGAGVGLLAALLLSLSLPQIWYARYPTSEMFAQAWFLGSLFLLALFLKTRRALFAAAAGIGLGQLFLIRVDTVVAILALLTCTTIWWLSDRRDRAAPLWLVGALVITLGHATLHNVLFATGYVRSLAHLYLSSRLITLAGPVMLAVAAGLALACRRPAPLTTILRQMRRTWIVGPVLAGVVALLWLGGTRGSLGLEGLRWLAWYLTPAGLIVAGLGCWLIVRDGLRRPAQVLLLAALLYALMYLPEPRAQPVQPWGVRRFVPVVLPALALALAYAVIRLPLPGRPRWHLAGRGVLAVTLAGVLVRSSQPVLAHDEYAGVWDQIGRLAQQFDPQAVVLFNRTGVGTAVAQPLTYLYDRPAFVLQRKQPDAAVLAELVAQWMEAGYTVYLAITGTPPVLEGLDAAWEPAGDVTLRIPRIERSQHHAPRQPDPLEWRIDLYRLVPGGVSSRPTRLDMEAGELAYLKRGFYDRETAPDGTTFRWTDGDAVLSIPVPVEVRRLTLRLAGPPAGIPSLTLQVLVDGTPAGTWTLCDCFEVYTVDLPEPATADGIIEVELRSNTWVPRQAGRGEDDRRLGVVVDWIRIE